MRWTFVLLPAFCLVAWGCSSNTSEPTPQKPVKQPKATQPEPAAANQAEPSNPSPAPSAQANNFSSKVTVLEVTLDSTPPPDNSTCGTWIHITWRNDTGHPLREVQANLELTDSAGNAVPYAPTETWLYAEKEPITPGKKHTSHDLISIDASQTGGTAKVTITNATETLSKL